MDRVKLTAMADGDKADYDLHDIGDIYSPYNHDESAAAVLNPCVREQVTWVVEKHGDVQRLYCAHHTGGNPHAWDRHRGHACFDDCDAFCAKWDQNSFDPADESLPLEFFRGMVRAVFGRQAYDPAVIRPGVRVPLTDAAVAATRG